MNMLPYEQKHLDYLDATSQECVLFLKRNDAFPLEKPGKVVLVGNGARQTIKGGTGSGDVSSRFFYTCEKGLEELGFEIISKDWLDKYDRFKHATYKQYVKDTKKVARKHHYLAIVYSMGFFEEEKNHDIECDYENDTCVYVLARNSGEGNDRRHIKGDVKLSEKEVKDILALNKRFEKFILVLNVGGVVDLSPVMEVGNILYLSQLGVFTGKTLAKVLLGQVNPSGKLSTTWATPEEYPFYKEFGHYDDTHYKEGIYVGYRYFDSEHKDVLFPFGYGLSYTTFSYEVVSSSLEGTKATVDVKVTNTGKMSGKEVIQVYLSCPNGKLDKPYQQLVGYIKTKELSPKESQVVTVTFDLLDNTSYDEETTSYILDAGNYIVRVGNSSRDTTPAFQIKVNELIVTKKVQSKISKVDFKDYVSKNSLEVLNDLKTYELDTSRIKTEVVDYHLETKIDPVVEKLTDEQLALLCLGQFGKGPGAIVGESSAHVYGAAGETRLGLPNIPEYLVMADGPAGIRVIPQYFVDKKGKNHTVISDPIQKKMSDFFPIPGFGWLIFKAEQPKHGEKIIEQYTTAIPIGTALAQSFNNEYVMELGKLVSEEMDYYGVDLWLAPALNIHRNILCGRNFEYYSEDPFLSGMMAASMTKGVQLNPKRGVTIKHYCCNNQEINRNNNNTVVSERAFREIYIKGFELAIKEADPYALMTSYNLVNGIHTSESKGIVTDILRCEWGYKGLVMSDWIASGRSFYGKHKHPAPYADNNILAGNDLTMPGCGSDLRSIKKALRKGKLTRQDLLISASRVYQAIKRQK